MKFSTAAIIAGVGLLTLAPQVRADTEAIARGPGLTMAVIGSYEVTVQLPVTATEKPSVPAEQVCAQLDVQLGTNSQKTCSFGGHTMTKNIFNLVTSTKAGPVYDAQHGTCVVRGSIRSGNYVLRVRYLTAPGTNTWTPPMTNAIESIAGEQTLSIKDRQKTQTTLRLQRAIAIAPPTLGC